MKIGYARVSTSDQNLYLQLDALDSVGCEFIFKDHGISGASDDRDGLNEALNKLSAGDTLIVWKLDRLGRSLGSLCRLIGSLGARGVSFISLTDGINTTTSSGKLLFHIIGALAEFERDLISERTKAGMESARARGTHIGRPRLLTSSDRCLAERQLKLGKTRKQIASELGVSINTLYRHLQPRAAGVRECK